jgi:predicted metal-binding transcription factor (methanogenesis marker protein 9)
MKGSEVANISVGTSVLKNRTVGSMVSCCKRSRQPIPTDTVMEKFDMEHVGSVPRRSVLLAANNRLQGNIGALGKDAVEVIMKVSNVELHLTVVNT